MDNSNKNDSDIFNQKLLLQEDKYVDFKPLRIFCGTFNVGKKIEVSKKILSLLFFFKHFFH